MAALLLCIAAATLVSAADPNVCTLPASALYISRAASPTPAPANTPARNATPTPSPTPNARTLCASQSAGVTVDAACVTACSCRRVESEVTPTRASRTIGVCINTSATFACNGNGVSDCAAYVLNADGSSTLKAQTGANSTKTPTPTPTPTSTAAPVTSKAPQPSPSTSKSSDESTSVPIAITNDKDDEKKGLAAWAWALIVAGAVVAIALTVFTVNWLKNQPRYTKGGGASDDHDHTDSARDSWRDGKIYIPQQDPPTRAGPSVSVAESEPVPVLGVAGQGYDAYRLGSTPGQTYRVHDSAMYSLRRSVDIDADSDDGSSSIELHSPTPVYSAPTDGRRSSMQVPPPPHHGGRTDRSANDSQLSYATSDGSYSSGIDASFSSQLTYTELEARDSDFAPLSTSGPQKQKSTEF